MSNCSLFLFDDSLDCTQAYHNELVTKVSRLEEENIKLKKEKARDFSLHLLCVLLKALNSNCFISFLLLFDLPYIIHEIQIYKIEGFLV